jgi:hypothetical protein
MSNPSGNAICQYYFNDISANYSVKNSKTSAYDLSLVNVGTASFPTSFPTITSIYNINLSAPNLYQVSDSSLNYSYYVNTNSFINNLTGSFSVSFWLYVDANTYTEYGLVWSLFGGAVNNLISLSSRYNNSNGRADVALSVSNNFIITDCNANAYNHFVVTVTTSGSSNDIRVYLNNGLSSITNGYGVSISSNVGTLTATILNGTTTKLYVLGGPPYVSGSSPGITWPANPDGVGRNDGSRGLEGCLGQLTIYNKALSPGEVTYLFNNRITFPPPPPPPCFKQGSKILKFDPITNAESYVPVETLRKGDLIKTIMSGYKPISHIGWKTLENPADAPDVRDRLYGLSSEIDEPLYLTGRHSILRNDLTESNLDILREYTGDVYVTEDHYRVPIFLDKRAKPYTDHKPVTIWHFALENESIYHNYGVMANGILVESSSAEYMTEHSNMELL